MSVLAEYARPLSRKRLYRLCRENLEEMGASEQSEFEEAIAVALGAGVLSESRPGVIGIPRKGRCVGPRGHLRNQHLVRMTGLDVSEYPVRQRRRLGFLPRQSLSKKLLR